MHTRRIVAFLLGAWLMGSVLTAFIAFDRLSAVERLLQSPYPAAAEAITSAGGQAARQIMRYQAIEQIHTARSYWGIAEIAIGLAVVALLGSSGAVNRSVVGIAGAMVLVAAFLRFVITPELHYLARGALIGGGPAPSGMRALYASLEAIKLLLGLSVAVYLFVYKRQPRRSSGRQINGVDHAEHSHIDG
jgi:hypothetical protein